MNRRKYSVFVKSVYGIMSPGKSPSQNDVKEDVGIYNRVQLGNCHYLIGVSRLGLQ